MRAVASYPTLSFLDCGGERPGSSPSTATTARSSATRPLSPQPPREGERWTAGPANTSAALMRLKNS
eukprot:5549930-Alexandrium_andersonii.AAC.1